MTKIISIDLKAQFGFFRKPETNNNISLSYNFLHRPAALGFVGAILGLKGYQKEGELPAYYQQLSHLKMAIAPLDAESCHFAKTNIKYVNKTGFGQKNSTLILEESTLIAPAYRLYFLIEEGDELAQELDQRLAQQRAYYLPYFGKNEHAAYWENYQSYDWEQKTANKQYRIRSLFRKEGQRLLGQAGALAPNRRSRFGANFSSGGSLYFERLPVDFDQELQQYILEDFSYTSHLLKPDFQPPQLYFLKEEQQYVQLY